MGKFKSNFFFQWWIVITVLLITRLPYLTGPHLSFDGDEAILGIMARDLLAGRNIPVYFYGQQYGFSFFEVLSTALGILIFGNSVWALKFGAMFIFSIGITFLFRYLLKHIPQNFWLFMTFFIITLFPAWLIWSMKDRGGYVTAFSMVCIVFYIVQLKPVKLSTILLVTMLVSLAIHAQAIIAIPALLLSITWCIASRKKVFWFILPVTMLAWYFLFKLPAYVNPGLWKLNLAKGYDFTRLMHFITETPKVFSGYHYYEMTFPVPIWIYITTLILSIGFFIISVSSLVNYPELKKYRLTLVVSALVGFIILPVMRFNSYRYELGFFTSLLLLVVLMLPEFIRHQTKWRITLWLMLASALVISFNSRNIPDGWMVPEGNDMKLYDELVGELNNRNLSCLYVTDPLLQWQLNFSGFNARYTSAVERTNRFINHIHGAGTQQKAIVGYKGMCNQMDTIDGWHDKVVYVNDKYFIYPQPEPELLIAGGFQQP